MQMNNFIFPLCFDLYVLTFVQYFLCILLKGRNFQLTCVLIFRNTVFCLQSYSTVLFTFKF